MEEIKLWETSYFEDEYIYDIEVLLNKIKKNPKFVVRDAQGEGEDSLISYGENIEEKKLVYTDEKHIALWHNFSTIGPNIIFMKSIKLIYKLQLIIVYLIADFPN